MGTILVGHSGQFDLIKRLVDSTPVLAVVNSGKTPLAPLGAAVFPRLDQGVAASQAQACCFLSPNRHLKKQIEYCLRHGLSVLSAGAPPLSATALGRLQQLAQSLGLPLAWGGQHRYSPVLCRIIEEARQPDFGPPVFLRHISTCATGLVSAWWSLDQAVALARDLLAAPLASIFLAGKRHGRKLHLSATVQSNNGAHGQLVLAPSAPPLWGDISLLGGGGMLTSPSLENLPVLINGARLQLQTPADLHPETAWLQSFLAGDNPAAPSPWTLPLLAGIRRIGTTQGPFAIAVPKD